MTNTEILDRDERDALSEAKRYMEQFKPKFKTGDCKPDDLKYAISACDIIIMFGSNAQITEYRTLRNIYREEYNMLITETHIM